MDDTPFLDELLYIIKQLGINSENGLKKRLFDYDRLIQWRNDLQNAENFGNVVDILKSSISRHRGVYFEPYLHMFLSYAYCAQSTGYDALDHAEYAAKMFESSENDWDKALAYWFCGIVYVRYPGRGNIKQELYRAIKFLKELSIHTLPDDYVTRNQCKSVIERIKTTIEHLPPQRPNYSNAPVDIGGHTRSDSAGDQRVNDPLSQRTPLTSSAEKDSSPSMNLHINIPIDIRSSGHFDQNSIQYLHTHQEQSANQNKESIFSSSNPGDVNFIDSTEPMVLHTPEESIKDDVKEETNIPLGAFDLSYLLTPSFPIYGKASAGPDGQVVLDEPDYTEVFDESSLIRVDGEEYEVYALKIDDRQISISYEDFIASITPKAGGKKYDWLKVVGNSMNNVEPIPIENADYVLFYKNPKPGLGKIVIASESILGSGVIRLLVKRLITKNERLWLHSESKNKNPVTASEYEDLEVDDCYQLIGEVIAIAKPKS